MRSTIKIFALAILMSLLPITIEVAEATPIGDATCSYIDGTVGVIDDFTSSELCATGVAKSIESTETGWIWSCYDANDYANENCTLNKEAPAVQEVQEVPDEKEDEPDQINIQRTEITSPLLTPVIDTPQPTQSVVEPEITHIHNLAEEYSQTIQTSVVTQTKDRSKSRSNQDLSNREIYEYYCGVSKYDMPKEWKKFSEREIYACCTGNPKEQYTDLKVEDVQ